MDGKPTQWDVSYCANIHDLYIPPTVSVMSGVIPIQHFSLPFYFCPIITNIFTMNLDIPGVGSVNIDPCLDEQGVQ